MLVAAPARTVAGALIELASRHGRVVTADVAEVVVDVSGSLLSGRCVQTAGGTLLTCSFSDGFAESVRARAEELAYAPVVVGTAVVRDGLLLAQQRAFPVRDAGMWELPGGRVEPGESDVDAVRRECAEELGVDVEPGETVGPDVVLPGGRLLRIYRATLAADAVPVAVEHRALRWLAAGELTDVPWLPADRVLLPALRAILL
jgi:8-oxo-dGTP diphosphatase